MYRWFSLLVVALVFVGGCGGKDKDPVCDPPCDTAGCYLCVDGDCEYQCTADQVCDGQGNCVTPSEDCDPPCDEDWCELCVDGECVYQCTGDQICDGIGNCLTPWYCDPPCNTDECYWCVEDQCVYQCTGDQVCDGEGNCVDPFGHIQIYSENPSYWQYKGEPVMLLGGSVKDNLFQIPDLEAHLDDIVAAGGNYVRNTMSDRTSGSWPVDYDLYPFKEVSSGTYDLTQWNDEYWTRFENFLEWTHEREIFVQIEVWDRFDYSRDHWLLHPYNPANNVNYTYAESGFDDAYPDHPGQNKQPFFFSVPALSDHNLYCPTVLPYQEAQVGKMLSYALQYDHVLYVIDNETSGVEEWATYWAEFIRAAAADAADKEVFITQMWDNWDMTHSTHRRTLDHLDGRYDFFDASQNTQLRSFDGSVHQTHWDRLMWVRDYMADNYDGVLSPINVTKVYHSDDYHTSDALAVDAWWRHVIAGTASTRFHRPTAGQGLNANAVAAIQSARKLESLIKPWDIEPDAAHSLLSSRSTNEAYLAYKAGEAYAMYFPDAGSASVGLDLSGHPGEYTVQWINVQTGDWGSVSTVQGGSTVTITTPSSGRWAAAITIEGYTDQP